MEAGKSELDGEHYDQVIDVDIDDNRPRLKLGVNNDDNPYDAADRYILSLQSTDESHLHWSNLSLFGYSCRIEVPKIISAMLLAHKPLKIQ